MKEGWVRDTPPQSRSGSGSVNTDLRRLRSGHHHHFTAPARGRERESVRRRGERGGVGEERERESDARERERRERGGAGQKGRELDGQGFRPPGILCRASLQICDEAKREAASLFIGKGKGNPRFLPNGPQRSPYSLGNFTGQEPGRYNPPPLIGIRPRIPKPTSFRPIVR